MEQNKGNRAKTKLKVVMETSLSLKSQDTYFLPLLGSRWQNTTPTHHPFSRQ